MTAVRFVELTEDEYSRWREKSIEGYSLDKVKAGNLEKETALESSRKEFETILPKGRLTEGNYLYAIQDEETNQNIGVIWYNTGRSDNPGAAYIYDIEVDERFRSKGYGTAALLLLEQKVKKLGMSKISLHVFGHNTGAMKLYEHLGYVATNVMMSKDLN